MDKQSKNKKIISLSIVLFIVMLLISGGSYAYLTWATATSERTNVALTITAPDMTATLTGYTQTISNLAPVSSCTDSTYAIKKQLTLTYENLSTNAGEILGTLSIENFTSPNGTPDSNDLSHLHYAVTTSDTNCTTDAVEGMSGTFKSTTGSLFSSQKLVGPIPAGTTETSDTYYLWVWLDEDYTHVNVGSGVTNDPMQNISFNLVWSGEIKNDLVVATSSGPEAPVLDDGMIPVTIANDGTVTTVASDDEDWYDYSNKEWANVVLVNENATADVEGSQSRSYYKNNTGVEVNQSDILAYYVWIPRYRYKVWTVEYSAAGNEQTIDIEFESASAETVLGTTVDSWRTHPAFIWDGETIAGIWVGKFETGHSTLSSSTTSNNLNCTDENCANADGLIIKPNVVSLRKNNISNFFYASRSMTRSGNPFGLTTNTDSHMMKNNEWGAVAYLSHSQYGINNEIYINNSSSHYTGRSGGNVGGSVNSLSVQFGSGTTATQYNSYGYYTWTGQAISSSGTIGAITDSTLGTKASTTGNITGVFDMSGGAYEYVMGNYNNTIKSDGFTTLPDSKYYDVYSITSNSSCTIDTCGGHALFETAGWYSDNRSFVSSDVPWFKRGGCCHDASGAGAWGFYGDGGDAGAYGTFRSTAIVGA